MNIDFKASIHNRFDIEVIDAKTGKLKQKCQAFNVICDTYWERVGHYSSNHWSPLKTFLDIAYGSGTGTPSTSDTTLFQYLNKKAMTNIVNNDITKDNLDSGMTSVTGSITLLPSDNVGDELTEVGLSNSDGSGSSQYTIYTHALIKDMNGNIISIQKTDTDIINIYATVYLHFSNTGWYNGAVKMVAPEFTRGSIVSYLSTILLGLDDAEILFAIYYSTSTEGDKFYHFKYIPSSLDHKHIAFNIRLEADQGNMPIRFILVCTSHHVSYGNLVYKSPTFGILVNSNWYNAPLITGEAVGTGDGLKTGFQTKFPIKTINGVYIDGILESNVSIRNGPVKSDEMILYFNRVFKSPNGVIEPCVPFYAYYESYYPESYQSGNAYTNTLKYTINKGQETPILENPYSTIGIIKIGFYNYYRPILLLVSASDDLENWIEEQVLYQHPTNLEYYDLPSTMKYKRYWKVKIVEKQGGGTSNDIYEIAFLGDGQDIENNVVFSAPPAVGSVITIDYTPDCIAKDEDHVFDFSLSLSFGEQVQS